MWKVDASVMEENEAGFKIHISQKASSFQMIWLS